MQSNEKFLQIFNCEKYLDMLELSDANLQTDDGCSFDVHRFALALSSDYFNRMFLGMDRGRRQFHIPGISGDCLSDILCCVYTGDTLGVGERNVADLIVGADYLLLDALRMKIKGNIEDYLSEVNCLRILLFAHRIGDEGIFRKCFRFVQTRFEGIVRRAVDDLTDLPLDILRRILSNHSLCVHDETWVWQAIVAWTQKDIPLRASCVPQLLLTLAVEDVGEELATEILQHEIVSENCCLVKDSVEEIASSPSNESRTNTNLDLLSTFFRSCSNRFTTEPILRHRIPLRLLAAWSDDDGGSMINLYAPHDENTHLLRKMTELRLWPEGLVAIEHTMPETDGERTVCMNFDLGAMKYVRTEIYTSPYFDFVMYFVSTDAYLFDLSNYGRGARNMSVYDIANGSSRLTELPHKVFHAEAAAIGKKLYVVGKSEDSDAMMTQVFDPDLERRFDPRTNLELLGSQWSVLSPPTVCHTDFSLVAHRQKIYLLGSSAAEVFSPATNLWKELPGELCRRQSPKPTVANDRIIVDDEKRDYVSWNDVEPCLEEFVRQIPPMEIRLPAMPRP